MCSPSHFARLVVAITTASVLTPPAGNASAALRAGLFGPEDLIISEIMYHPRDKGNITGEEYEFIELKNTGVTALDISGFSFDRGITYTFPAGTILGPGQIVTLAANAARFQERYGFPALGTYAGSLSNGGETIAMLNVQSAVLLELEYDDDAPWPFAADGAGFAMVPVDATARFDHSDARQWRLSAEVDGSPGADDGPAAPPAIVLVNELLAHTDPPQQDAVELHNASDRTVNVGGWYLTDDVQRPTRYRIPTGTTIPPGGFLVLDEDDFNPSGASWGFSFSESGEDVLLFAADESGRLTGTVHGFRFAASENQVSFGRHVDSIGNEHFVRQRTLTFGQENSGPRPSPVVITEIMYRPHDDAPEFIELVNVSDGVVPMMDALLPQNTWRIDGIQFNFPPGIVLAPSELVIVTSGDPAAFRARHGLPETLRVLGPYGGALSNAGERIVLQKPGPPDDSGEVPYVTMESVTYADDPPWPTSADGDGPSLERTDVAAYSDDPANWRPSAVVGGTPGDFVGTPVDRPWLDPDAPVSIQDLYPNPFAETAIVEIQVVAAQEVEVSVYDVTGRRVATLFRGMTEPQVVRRIALEGASLPSGVYFVRLRCANGETARPIVHL